MAGERLEGRLSRVEPTGGARPKAEHVPEGDLAPIADAVLYPVKKCLRLKASDGLCLWRGTVNFGRRACLRVRPEIMPFGLIGG